MRQVLISRGPEAALGKFSHSDNLRFSGPIRSTWGLLPVLPYLITSAYPVDSTSPKGWGSGAMLPEYPPSFREFRMLFSDETSCWCPQRSPYQ